MHEHKEARIALYAVLGAFFLIAIVGLKDYADSHYFSLFYIPVMERVSISCNFVFDGNCYVPYTLGVKPYFSLVQHIAMFIGG